MVGFFLYIHVYGSSRIEHIKKKIQCNTKQSTKAKSTIPVHVLFTQSRILYTSMHVSDLGSSTVYRQRKSVVIDVKKLSWYYSCFHSFQTKLFRTMFNRFYDLLNSVSRWAVHDSLSLSLSLSFSLSLSLSLSLSSISHSDKRLYCIDFLFLTQ